MDRLSNTQGITKIVMKPVAVTKCVIGQDWYRNELEVEFYPDSCYPDYMEVDDFIMREIDGKEFNIEDVVNNIYKMLWNTYQPKKLLVRDYITNSKTHFNVVVEKE